MTFDRVTKTISAALDSGAPTIESTFVLVRSDGVARNLTGPIIERLNGLGFKMLGLKFVWMTQSFLDQYMELTNPFPFYPEMALMSPGPGVAMVWEGLGAVNAVISLIGSSDPSAVAPGTIRGDYGITEDNLIIHSSYSKNDAHYEIILWFDESELVAWKPSDFL